MVAPEEPGDSFTAGSVRIAVGRIRGRVSMMGQKVECEGIDGVSQLKHVVASFLCEETAKTLKESH